MEHDAEVLVVGGGVMGAATAWQLARRGHEVLLLERFEPAHAMGASHGPTRNFNVAYADQHYLDLVFESRSLWKELETEAGLTLLDKVGLINHGGGRDRWEPVREALTARGEIAEWVEPEQAARRWPALRLRDRGLWIPEGARIRATDALAAFHAEAGKHGGEVRYGAAVQSLQRAGDAGVTAETETEKLSARTVVVTAGGWSQQVAGALVPLPDLVVTQEQPAHFAVRDAGLTELPGFNHAPDSSRPEDDFFRSVVYGMLTPGEGIKAGWHGVGPVTDPDARSFEPEPQQLADLQRYAREWLPGADPESFVPISCTYTSTPTADFVLDAQDGVVVGAGFSGHGYKFAPAIGRVLADLATGRDAHVATPFRMAPWRRPAPGSVGNWSSRD